MQFVFKRAFLSAQLVQVHLSFPAHTHYFGHLGFSQVLFFKINGARQDVQFDCMVFFISLQDEQTPARFSHLQSTGHIIGIP